MLCKVKVFHHSYPLKKDVEVDDIVDLPDAVVEKNPSFYEVVSEVTPVERKSKPTKEALKAFVLDKKLVKREEVDIMSYEQLFALYKSKE